MNKLILIILCLFLWSCDFVETEKESSVGPWSTACLKPESIPDTLYDGTKVHWDCNWTNGYANGKVRIIKDSLGRVKAIARHMN